MLMVSSPAPPKNAGISGSCRRNGVIATVAIDQGINKGSCATDGVITCSTAQQVAGYETTAVSVGDIISTTTTPEVD